MPVTGLRTYDTYTEGEAIVVDATRNIVAVSGAPTAQSASAIHGVRGAKMHAVTPAEAVIYGANPTDTRSFYGVIDTEGGGTATFGAIKNGATFLARIRGNSTGDHYDLADQAGTTVYDTTAITYTAGTNYRIDVQWSYSAPQLTVEARIFQGANVEGYIPDEVLGPNTFAVAAAPNRFSVGSVSSSWAVSIDTVREYGDALAWPVPFLSSAALSMRPVREVSNTNWAMGSGTNNATNRVNAQSDASDATFIISAAAGTSTERVALGPGITPDTAQVKVRADITGAGPTLHFKLYEGEASATVLEDFTIPVSTTLNDHIISFNALTIAAINDWTNLYYEYVAV